MSRPSDIKATIIVPLLVQDDRLLRTAVESALNQTVRCRVLVVCSQATPVSNRMVLDELGAASDRLKVLEQAGKGFANAINTGFGHSTSERVGLLLSDDILWPLAVEKCLDKTADIVSTGQYTVDEKGHLLAVERPCMVQFGKLESLEAKASCLTHFFLFNRSAVLAVGGVDENIGSTGPDDYDLIWTMLENGASVEIVSEPLYSYRDHPGQRLSLKEPAIQIRALQRIFNKHALDGCERHRLLESHAVWFGVSLQQGLKAEELVVDAGCSQTLKPQHDRMIFQAPELASNTGSYRGDGLRCDPSRDRAGHCVYGPGFTPDGDGDYRAEFSLSVSEFPRDGGTLFTLDVYDSVSDTILAIQDFDTDRYLNAPAALGFVARTNQALEFRVFWHANNMFDFQAVAVFRVGLAEEPDAAVSSAKLRDALAPPTPRFKTALSSSPDVSISDQEDFRRVGFKAVDYFQHEVVVLQKPYPDSHLVLEKAGIVGERATSGRHIQLNLYATNTGRLPDDIWFHPDLNWHRQHLGRPGLVGAVGLFLPDSCTAIVSIMQSDLLQQLFRHQPFKHYRQVVEGSYKPWYKLLWNAVMRFALDNGIQAVYGPTSENVSHRTVKQVRRDLFRRVYDYPSRRYTATRMRINADEYWKIEVGRNEPYIAGLKRSTRSLDTTRTICLLHDIEADIDTDIPFGQCIDQLQRMLEIEQGLALPSTYNLLGKYYPFFMEVLGDAGNLAFGFHSYDHRIDRLDHLERVRRIDLQVAGYRPPRSVLTPELTDHRLSYHNFEWLASSAACFGFEDCRLVNGIVRIPIFTDDYPLVTGERDFDDWADEIVTRANGTDFFAFSVHDCYAEKWLEGYGELLRTLSTTHEFANCDQVAAHVFAASARYANPHSSVPRQTFCNFSSV